MCIVLCILTESCKVLRAGLDWSLSQPPSLQSMQYQYKKSTQNIAKQNLHLPPPPPHLMMEVNNGVGIPVVISLCFSSHNNALWCVGPTYSIYPHGCSGYTYRKWSISPIYCICTYSKINTIVYVYIYMYGACGIIYTAHGTVYIIIINHTTALVRRAYSIGHQIRETSGKCITGWTFIYIYMQW